MNIIETQKQKFDPHTKQRKFSRTSNFQFMGVDDALVPLLSVSELSRPEPTTNDLVRQNKKSQNITNNKAIPIENSSKF